MTHLGTAADPLYVVHRIDRALARNSLPTLRGRVLDLGAGDQPFRDLLPASVEYVAADRHPGAGVLVCCDACALPFASETFDSVICTEVLEHLSMPWVAVAEITRCLRVGGRLYVTAPMNWHLHYAPHDYFRFTRYGLESLLRGVGLEVLTVQRGGGTFSAATGKLTEAFYTSVLLPVLQRMAYTWTLYRLVSLLLFPLAWTASLLCSALDRVFTRDAYIWAILAVKPMCALDPAPAPAASPPP